MLATSKYSISSAPVKIIAFHKADYIREISNILFHKSYGLPITRFVLSTRFDAILHSKNPHVILF